MAVLVRFTRIGRDRDAKPMRIPGASLEVDQGDAIAKAVYDHVAPKLFSRDTWVDVDLAARWGRIYAGVRNAGEFWLTEVEDDE